MSLDSVNNYFRKYSAHQEIGSFHHVHRTSFGNYSFVCADATLTPGPKRPYNFFGILNQSQVQVLDSFRLQSLSSNQSIWFGHYTTSTIVSPAPGVRTLMRSALAYLCGHLHTLGGLVPVLHSRHPQGTLELELGDWMDNRRFRVVALDHDLLSFSDVTFDLWPVVVITNPKDAQYVHPGLEPLERIGKSTHIRLLVFSDVPVSSVLVRVDGKDLGPARSAQGPLYVLQWDPSLYSTGLHTISITAQDSSGRSVVKQQHFSLEDNLTLSFGFVQSFILLTDHHVLGKVAFAVTVLLNVGALLLFRRTRFTGVQPKGLVSSCCSSLQLLSQRNWFYYSLLLFNLSTAFGPWFVGEMIDGHSGACFSFGVVIDGHFLEGSLTYVVGVIQMLFYNMPLTLYLCWTLHHRCSGLRPPSLRPPSLPGSVCGHVTMLLLLCWQLHSCYFLLETYGLTALLLSPTRTWALGLGFCSSA
uniref:Transmembrane protein 62 n=1 Tax=Knipowitschia caucasica TaxID=637954 RepID=A0AAV2JI22_KNICA